jgi:CHAD domain-containing protein
VAEAARRTLRQFFDRLHAREEDVLKGEDAEDVHQMRVATRRLRASLQVVEGVYDPKQLRHFRRGLRRLARSLGAVRDGDVLLEHIAAYREALPEGQRTALLPLSAAVETERARARKALLAVLKSKRYARFKRKFAAFLTTPGDAVLPPPEPGITQRVRDFAGSVIWRRYELWRAHETALPSGGDEARHQARIAGKRLRYTLEFFADALGPNVAQALDPLIALQENLGAIQDDVTAGARVAALGLASDPGAQAYLAARASERAGLLAELPQRWEKVASATYRRRLFELILKL